MVRIRPYLLPLAAGALLFASCAPRTNSVLLQPSEALGTVLGEETARIAGSRKTVTIIAPDANWGAASTVEQAFKNSLKKQGLTIVTAKAANLGDPMRRGQLGLKPADFLNALEQSAGAAVVVSLAGPPVLGPNDAARVPAQHPPVLVVATSSLGNVPGLGADQAQLARLLDAGIIQFAIIDGASEPAPSSAATMDAPHQLFSQNYRILHRPD